MCYHEASVQSVMFSLKVHATRRLDKEALEYLSERPWIPVASKQDVCLLTKGCRTVDDAAATGHIECIKVLHKNGVPWDAWACAFAAKHAHIDTLQWLRASGAPWDEKACTFAAEHGHLETLKWLRANGAPWDAWPCAHTVWMGHFDTLQWLRANGAPICNHTRAQASLAWPGVNWNDVYMCCGIRAH